MEASTRNKLLTATLALLVVVNVVLMVFLFLGRPDGPERKSREDGKHDVVENFNRCLGFTTEQQQAFKVAFDTHKDRMKRFNSQIETGKDQLTELLADPESPRVDSLIAAQGQLRLEEERELFRHMTEVYGICDETQREKLVKVFKKSFRKRHKK